MIRVGRGVGFLGNGCRGGERVGREIEVGLGTNRNVRFLARFLMIGVYREVCYCD